MAQMDLLSSCESEFDTRDLYAVFNLPKHASIKDVKTNYRKLVIDYHPDKAGSSRNDLNFNVLQKTYEILTDPETKKIYDDTGKVVTKTWTRKLRPISDEMLAEAKAKYVGSKKEERDLIKEFERGKGSMLHLLNNIPFMRFEDEERVIIILKKLLATGKISQIPIKKLNNK